MSGSCNYMKLGSYLLFSSAFYHSQKKVMFKLKRVEKEIKMLIISTLFELSLEMDGKGKESYIYLADISLSLFFS